ncbi:flexible cuticle protein 12-like [Arctopsyche grandis]|uniref:flexible cuticle protein 12-like n=1 Tax=Arctopsyche grandis TaxID=121162 RepID=UPI00406D6331
MKIVLIALSIIFVVTAAPASKQPVAILKYHNVNDGLGNYTYAFETSDGIKQNEQAQIYNPDTDKESYVVTGSYSYVGPDGVTYAVNYVADANGFRPQGAHIPKFA